MHSSSQRFVGIYVRPTNQKYSDDANAFVLVPSLHSAKQKLFNFYEDKNAVGSSKRDSRSRFKSTKSMVCCSHNDQSNGSCYFYLVQKNI